MLVILDIVLGRAMAWSACFRRCATFTARAVQQRGHGSSPRRSV